MKKTTYTKWAAFIACACISATSGVNAATTVLVDFVGAADSLGAHNTEVLNGGFTGFTNTSYAPWVMVAGTAEFKNATDSNHFPSPSGGTNYVIDSNRILAVDTGHTIATGDEFNVGFAWRDAWAWSKNNDTISLNLYYTDNDAIDGTATDIAVLDSGAYVTKNTWENKSATGLTFNDANAVGKKLFLSIKPHAGAAHYARVDDIFLDVTSAPVPEPSSAALLGLGGIALILRRRK